MTTSWIITRNGFSCSEDFSKYLSSKRHILVLDAVMDGLRHCFILIPLVKRTWLALIDCFEVAAENLNHL